MRSRAEGDETGSCSSGAPEVSDFRLICTARTALSLLHTPAQVHQNFFAVARFFWTRTASTCRRKETSLEKHIKQTRSTSLSKREEIFCLPMQTLAELFDESNGGKFNKGLAEPLPQLSTCVLSVSGEIAVRLHAKLCVHGLPICDSVPTKDN